ncbi:putative leucine-rich repeat domain superfamily [Helianthus annuus]|nr:putative leucine-rich repeat domain superfamily [Helianthus annuus]
MLRLRWTSLSGPVPLFLGQLTNLNFLDLSFNNLIGSITPELAKLTQLGALHLDRNKLTGTIPESFEKFTENIPDLYLSHNQLTGDIPKSLRYLNFTVIDFSRNQLTDVLFFFYFFIYKKNKAKWQFERFELKIPKIPLVKNGVFGLS